MNRMAEQVAERHLNRKDGSLVPPFASWPSSARREVDEILVRMHYKVTDAWAVPEDIMDEAADHFEGVLSRFYADADDAFLDWAGGLQKSEMKHVIAAMYTKKYRKQTFKNASLTKTAGEVRFIKDKSGDKSEWGWGSPGPTEREIQEDFEYKSKNMKPLAETLRASLLAMGHALSAHATFNRIKSAQVSPDGSLGGKGYIQKIPDMRRQLMNVCEALSSVTDTLYDEIKAPHWDPAKETQGKRERDEVKNILNDVDEIRSDPEGFAEKEEADMDSDTEKNVSEDGGGAVSEGGDGPSGKYARQKLASLNPMPIRVATRYLELTQEVRA